MSWVVITKVVMRNSYICGNEEITVYKKHDIKMIIKIKNVTCINFYNSKFLKKIKSSSIYKNYVLE